MTINSDPAGARVRVGGLPFLPTPHTGQIVRGEYDFQFAWGNERTTVRARIDRDGQSVTGRRRQ